ncbi:hypothetical protein ACFLZ4_02380 [Patescibacteria group bacterium]
MEKLTKLPFNPKPSTVMHIDINSCFATIEQQANPHLRGKPIAVAAFDSPSGCILASSIEAKKLGIKTGFRVKEGRLIYPNLIVLEPDPPKYRDVHLKLRNLLKTYTENLVPKSIDEFVLNLEGYPAYKKGMFEVGSEIKRRIKKEIGEWITVSVGIGPNRFLSKTASSLNKPDGLDEINIRNHLDIFRTLKLTDLCGIASRNAARLGTVGIYSVLDFFNADIPTLKRAFQSINGYYWHLRLHGWEIDDVDFGRKSFGNSYALPKSLSTPEELAPILYKLVVKTSERLRRGGYKARGVHVAVSYKDRSYWHHGRLVGKQIFDTNEIFKEAFRILSRSPYKKPVRVLAESVFALTPYKQSQLNLFEDIGKKERLNEAVDTINNKWGDYAITPAMLLDAKEYIQDRIAFGGVKELVG